MNWTLNWIELNWIELNFELSWILNWILIWILNWIELNWIENWIEFQSTWTSWLRQDLWVAPTARRPSSCLTTAATKTLTGKAGVVQPTFWLDDDDDDDDFPLLMRQKSSMHSMLVAVHGISASPDFIWHFLREQYRRD